MREVGPSSLLDARLKNSCLHFQKPVVLREMPSRFAIADVLRQFAELYAAERGGRDRVVHARAA